MIDILTGCLMNPLVVSLSFAASVYSLGYAIVLANKCKGRQCLWPVATIICAGFPAAYSFWEILHYLSDSKFLNLSAVLCGYAALLVMAIYLAHERRLQCTHLG